MEEGKGQGGLATSHQYGNALLGVCYQEEVTHFIGPNLICIILQCLDIEKQLPFI